MTGKSRLSGIGVSDGVVTAPALVIDAGMPELAERPVFAGDVEAELKRLDEALTAVRDNLRRLELRTRERAGPEEAKIFEAQAMMVEDELFVGRVRQLIQENHVAAERAFEFVSLELREVWLDSDNKMLQDKVEDLSAILVRVLRRLVGEPETIEWLAGGEPRVIVTRELTAGLTVEFDRERVAAFVSEEGTRTSHAAILARSLGIPCVMGVVGATSQIEDGQTILLDGADGVVIVEPGSTDIARVRERDRVRHTLDDELEGEVNQPSVTLDGSQVALRVNLDLPEELDQAVAAGAAGVGLVRTEFLLMGRTNMPSEDEQCDYFKRIARSFEGEPVQVRSYDLGGDKFPKSFKPGKDPNPFLGWRAIRVCLDYPDLFFNQLKAIARARVEGDVQLLLPLISTLKELDDSKGMVDMVLADLRNQGVEAPDYLPVGVMVETPASVMMIDEIAASCDFLSVGTNDLTQYSLAVDRSNARLATRFRPLDPSVVRMLKRVADAAGRAAVPLSVCGELASDPFGVFLLLGLGYESLSVSPSRIPLTRWLIRRVDLSAARVAAQTACSCRTHEEVRTTLISAMKDFVDVQWLEHDRLPAASARGSFSG